MKKSQVGLIRKLNRKAMGMCVNLKHQVKHGKFKSNY